jgi:hypothetical protein
MSERDTDFEFDFFDEPETREGPATDRIPRVGPRRPSGPNVSTQGLLRLVVLVAAVILLVVLLVVGISSCSGSGARGTYERYMSSVRRVAGQSDAIGKQLSTLLTTPGLKTADLDPRLSGLAQQQLQGIQAAQQIRAPASLRLEQQHVVESLRERAVGLQGLADVFHAAAATKDNAAVAKSLAQQSQRLVASDVIWEDFFRAPSEATLQRKNVTGVIVPSSTFVQNPDLASSAAWTPLLQRLRGASTGGNDNLLHGTGLVSVVALPKGQRLVPAPTENTVIATPDLAFEVTVQDTGDAQEVQVPVILRIEQSPKPIVKKLYISQINPNETQKVVFKDIGPVKFAAKVTIHVEVTPVQNEKNTSNNSADYPAIFSLS